MIIAETKRLIISKMTIDDAPFYLELVNTPNWIKYIGDRGVKTIEDAKLKIEETIIKSYDEYGFGAYKLMLKEDYLRPIGSCGLYKRDYFDHPDIGFALLEAYEGKGYGFESSEAIIKLAKQTFQIKKLLAITIPTNISSIKLLKKLDLAYEKKVKPYEDEEELLLFVKSLI